MLARIVNFYEIKTKTKILNADLIKILSIFEETLLIVKDRRLPWVVDVLIICMEIDQNIERFMLKAK